MPNSQKGSPRFAVEAGFAPIITILGIVLLLGIAGGAYFVGTRKNVLAPATPKACTQEAKICPDGSAVSRTGPNCEFSPCSTTKPIPSITVTPSSTNSAETATWKTYASTLGYSFRYPNNLKIKDFTISDIPNLKNSINIESVDESVRNIFSGFNDWIYVWDNLGIQINDLETRKLWCDKLQPQLIGQLECVHSNNLSVVDINGYKAYLSNGGRDNSTIRTIYIPHGNYVYEINLNDGFPEKLGLQQLNNQILSTFKFTN